MKKKERYWTFLVYPDSVPINYIDYLDETHLPYAISPLHDKDTNPDGTIKKPHYHILICFNGPTTFTRVKSITDDLNQPIPLPVLSVKGMFRYLTHKDNPEKYQYNYNEIKCRNGFDIEDYKQYTNSEILALKIELLNYIEENNVKNIYILTKMLLHENNLNLLKVLTSNTYFFVNYINEKNNFILQK